MTILAADIKLLASERMTDTTDGGGKRTSNVIADGVPGNIFPKVSRLDSVYGRVNLRKVFAHVDTVNNDTYAGAHAAIIDAADNNKIKVNIFSTASDFDDRTAARDRIESYVISGPDSRMTLYGRQLVGQQAITVIQRVEEPLPDVGEVYCLSTEIGGVVSAQQYVRIEDVTHEVRTFTDSSDFTRRVITMKVGAPLRYEFAGQENVTRSTSFKPNALIRTTTVADAARYFGISSLQGTAHAGDLNVTLDSVFSSIVPTNQREAALNSTQLAGAAQYVPIGAVVGYRDLGPSMPEGASNTSTFQLGHGVIPRSFSVRLGDSNLRRYNTVVTDDGNGNIPAQDPMPGLGWHIFGGSINYDSGEVTILWHGQGQGSMILNATYAPGVAVSQAAHVKELPVTLATRGTVQAMILAPLPAKGTVIVDYRALGKWYRLRDDGTGQIGGNDAAYGTGSVDPVTGNLVVTLGALPDVGSSVIISWGSPVHYEMFAGATAQVDTAVQQTFTLTGVPVKPGTLSIKYTAGTTEYTAAADVNGAISGGGVTGTVNHVTGEVVVRFATRAPNVGSALTVSYSKENPNSPAAPTSVSGTGTIAPTSLSFATTAGIAAKGLRVVVPVMLQARNGRVQQMVYLPAQDDGAGGLVTLAVTGSAQDLGYSHAGGAGVGTVNLATGSVTINPNAQIDFNQYSWNGTMWSLLPTHVSPAMGEYAWSVRTTSASTPLVVNATVTQVDAPLQLDLVATSSSRVVPGSVRFSAFGVTYKDNGQGALIDMASGQVAGSFDYTTGIASLTSFTGNVALGVSVAMLLTKRGDHTAHAATFRTAGSPLRPGSTFIQVTADDGETLTSTCDVNGFISGGNARGSVNQQMGIVHIEWGSMVVAAGNEAQPWYDPANVVGTQVWKPREVLPETIRYSTVVLTSLPVNADILGLDPVRLPTDGRVPIFRAGDVVLVHNTKVTVLPNAVAAGATYNLGRTNLADIVLLDANGLVVALAQYAFDLAQGTVTMAANMNLAAYTQPLKVRHRAEELNLATDVQINGQVGLASPLSRDFDADTKVSSCLLFGDMFARVSNVFDQVSWTAQWSDARIGTNATPEFNNAAFPITTQNSGAVTERWRVNFTTTTAFQVIGENLGVIATGDIATDCSPVNPLTGKPYFFIPKGGWGAGWAIGNQLRFNTYGATGPIWMARTVLPGATLAGDSIDIQVRGDVDA